MERSTGPGIAVPLLGALAIALSIAIGTALRLIDPLSSSVIPAEDPYTHMAYVREHLRTGLLEPLNPPGGLYPPGLHALLAAVWVFTGSSLYEIVRLGPVFFGAVGILGMGILLWRFIGPIGGAIGALGYAIVPELVFRSSMMAPTALDLALLPFLLYGILHLTSGNIRYLAVGVPLALFLVFAHPWLFGILGVAAIVFVLLAVLMPWRTRHSPAASALGLAFVLALLAGGLGLSLTGCGGYCGPGFSELLPASLAGGWLAGLFLFIALAPAAILTWKPHAFDALMPGPHRRPLPVWAALIMSGAIAIALLVATVPAMERGMPEQVNVPGMIGMPVLYLSFFALIALPFMASRLAYLGAALFVPTYPMVIYDMLHSPYWSHRTVVFLAVALVLLLGAAAEALVRWSVQAARVLGTALTRRRKSAHRAGLPGFAVFSVALIATVSLAGCVFVNTPEPYPGGWYRLYPECELDAMRDVAAEIDQRPDAIVMVGDWRARVVLVALAHDPSRIWLSDAFYTMPSYREEFLEVRKNHHDDAIYVVLDRHASANSRDADLSFLEQHPWQQVGTWCSGMGFAEPRMTLYRVEAHQL